MAQQPTAPLARRTILRTAAHAAWAVPVVSVATAAPAFAASPIADDPAPTATCTPTGYESPGEGGNSTKDYYVVPSCTGATVTAVEIYDKHLGEFRSAELVGEVWRARGFKSSANDRRVLIHTTARTFDVTIAFPPLKN